MASFYISTAIPYVNADPHLGFALELVQADVLARYHRLVGDQTFFLTGTDENSLTNVLSAERESLPVRALVDRNAEVFRSLTATLGISNDDFIRTSADRRHLEGATRFWQACEQAFPEAEGSARFWTTLGLRTAAGPARSTSARCNTPCRSPWSSSPLA